MQRICPDKTEAVNRLCLEPRKTAASAFHEEGRPTVRSLIPFLLLLIMSLIVPQAIAEEACCCLQCRNAMDRAQIMLVDHYLDVDTELERVLLRLAQMADDLSKRPGSETFARQIHALSQAERRLNGARERALEAMARFQLAIDERRKTGCACLPLRPLEKEIREPLDSLTRRGFEQVSTAVNALLRSLEVAERDPSRKTAAARSAVETLRKELAQLRNKMAEFAPLEVVRLKAMLIRTQDDEVKQREELRLLRSTFWGGPLGARDEP
jgi:hypothetical protein